MRLLTVTNLPPVCGGAEILSEDLLLATRDRLAGSVVVTAARQVVRGPRGCATARIRHDPGLYRALEEQGIRVVPLLTVRSRPYVCAARARPHPALVRRLVELIIESGTDLVHEHFIAGCTRETLEACRLTGVPLILTIHARMDLHPRPDHVQRLPYDAAERQDLARRASACVVVSAEMLEECRRLGIHHTTLVPNGVNRDAFAPVPGRRRRGILFVGKNRPIKGITCLVEAFTRIAGRVGDDLVLVGRDICQAAFEAGGFGLHGAARSAAAALIASGRIRMHDELPHGEVRDLHRGARVLALPSRTEAMPLVVLEALSSGTPVVASRVGAIPSLVRPGATGELVEPDDPASLAEALLEVLGHPHRYPEAGCRESIAAYGIEACADAHLALFRSLVRQPAPATGTAE